MVPIVWKSLPERLNVGLAEQLEASQVAEACIEYADLAPLGERLIWGSDAERRLCAVQKVRRASVRDVSDRTRESRRRRYALAVGTGLLAFEVEAKKKREAGTAISDDVVDVVRQSIAAAVLADLKAYDELAKETGIEEMQQTASTAEPAPA